MTAATFAAVFATFYVAHMVADHWVQTENQAALKGRHDHVGRLACAAHVASYQATQALMLWVTYVALELDLSVTGFLVGHAISTGTHYWADRRTTLAKLATLLRKDVFYRLGAPRPDHDDNPSLGTGAYALDQSFHLFFLWVAALVTVLV